MDYRGLLENMKRETDTYVLLAATLGALSLGCYLKSEMDKSKASSLEHYETKIETRYHKGF